MWKSYLLTAFRSIARNNTSFLINVSGLVLGFTCSLIIGLYVYHELSYDTFHKNASRIFRVTHNEKGGAIPGTRHLATVGPPVAPALKAAYPQVEDAVRFRDHPDRIMRYKDNQYYENRIYYVDPSIFNVFSFSLAKGDVKTALQLPNSVVVTREMAAKYFGTSEPIGQILTMDNTTDLKVTGVLDVIPENHHLKFDFLLPFEAFKVPFGYPVTLESWGWISFHTYVLLRPGEDVAELQAQLPDFVKSHWPADRAERFRMELQPLRDIYLGDVKNDVVESGNKTYLSVLIVAGVLILVIAGFNFANLFSASSAARAKEMGVRKVIGAQRRSVATQLIGESILTSFIAAGISLSMLPLIVPVVSTNFAIRLDQDILFALIALTLLAAILIGLFGGLAPSTLLSSFDHLKLLKGAFRTSSKGVSARMGLVLAQFSVSIMLVACVFTVRDQIDFLLTKDLGYAKDELMILRFPGDQLMRRFPSLKNKLLQNPDITGVSIGGGRMDGDNGNVPIYVPGITDEAGIPMAIDAVTIDYFNTIGVSLVSGQEFTEDNLTDTLNGVILNELAVKTFGWTAESAIGKRMRVGNFAGERQVIGVVPNYHFGSLHNSITPLVISYPRTRLRNVYVRFNAINLSQITSSFRADWDVVAPDLPFDFVFLNQHLGSLYRAEQSFLLLFRFFAGIAITIACLGLYGLISQDLVYRVKEIGIRKVLGASVRELILMILKKFVLIVLLANIIAWPMCWQLMQNWLNEFSYHQPMNWLVFPVAGGIILTIAILTVSFRTVAAAQANPAKSIRAE